MATQVEFHTGVADELHFTCRLLRKAYAKGARVLVRSPQLAALDRALWTFAEREFVPHIRFAAPGPLPAHAARTPIWLVEGELPADPPPVLVNIGAERVDGLGAFERIIEIVGNDADAADRARERWRAYRAAGLEVVHHPAAADG